MNFDMDFALKVLHVAKLESFAYGTQKIVDEMLEDTDDDEEDEEIRTELEVFKGFVKRAQNKANETKRLLVDEIEEQLVDAFINADNICDMLDVEELDELFKN